MKKIKEVHKNRFVTLPAIKLTAEQCKKWCEKARIKINPGKKGLRDAMVRVIEFGKPEKYRNVITHLLSEFCH